MPCLTTQAPFYHVKYFYETKSGSSGDERETILTVASIWWPEGKAQLEILLLKKGGGLGKFSVILIVSNLG